VLILYSEVVILGITGLFAAGKDTAANYLEAKGFQHISLSSILREEAKKRKVEPTRENLIKLGTDLKDQEGYFTLAQRAQARIKDKAVITSLRHPAEVSYFKKMPNFRLIMIDAPADIRYKRAKKRARLGDNIESFKQFIALENKERNHGGGQELDGVLEKSDYRIDNSSDFNHLYRQLDELIEGIKNVHPKSTDPI
jgi:dephospho-CoA kinase